MTTDETPDAAAPRPASHTPTRRRPRIDWAHNPKDTSTKDILWFLAIPVVMAVLTTAVVLTALSTSAP